MILQCLWKENFPIYNELIIMKDELANVYWPFLGINTIGNMLPGQAYAIKLYSDSDFSYLMKKLQVK